MSKKTMKRMQAATALWSAWRDAGHEPKTRAAAIRIIKRELRKAGNNAKLEEISQYQAKSIKDGEDEKELSASLSLVVWDLTVNNGQCLDYSIGYNYFAGLLQQAGHIIRSYNRITVESSLGKKTVPMFIHRPKVGTRKTAKLKPEEIQEDIDRYIVEAQDRIIRWRFIGANINMIKSALRAIEREALRIYSEEEAAA